MTQDPASAPVRPARECDLLSLVAVELAADELFAEVGIRFPPGTTVIEGVSDPSRVLVCGDPPEGFALTGTADGLVHLEQLAVRPSAGRRGIGGRLLAAVCDHAARLGVPGVTLTTYRDVPWNAPWYARHGFTVLPREHWGDELAALVAHERDLGIEVAPRVVMFRAVGCPNLSFMWW
ncbi:GCN5 family N-acetyltransferase [Microtetraspora sp. NBRC 13810]|uniref:GNAT family N-acetyltransferase n=1 Tax=Microtetraspora sp. NBRC 13810 TaxID=3030990 RepID=UPI0024A1E046|nr:GNAT family N-acetyltransferase [Microtetraspora sp. NBRC 13810]GLW08478.1 GCN5 family N-acetyltransferase [Microtetraspora sp. NBRC 13810]